MAIRTLILGAAALVLTTTASFASPVHTQTQLGERHVNYASAQWNSPLAASPAANNGRNAGGNTHGACPIQCD